MARGPWARGPPAPPVRPWLVAAVIVAAAVAAAADDVAVAVDVAVVAVANSPRNLTQVLPTPRPPEFQCSAARTARLAAPEEILKPAVLA